MSSFLSISLLGSLLCFTATAFALDSSSTDSCTSSTKHYRASIKHIEGGGVGYNQGYTTFQTFLALDPDKYLLMPFMDLRGHVFDNGKFAANAGVGFRMIGKGRVYGANVYYDYRNTKRSHHNQIGVGLETLGVRWDFRINGYLPIGNKTSHFYGAKTTLTSPVFEGFQGNNVLLRQTFTTQKKKQYAMKGLNMEAAFHILKNEKIDLYAAAGPYYYNYGSKQAVGGQARIGAQIYEYLSLEAINSYDSRFHENIQGRIGINIPFGPKAKKGGRSSSCLLSQRLVQDVARQEIIVVDKMRKTTSSDVISSAIDPLTGNPYFLVFVDNTSHSLGTYESPYPTFALAQENSKAGDIIYVFPGDGTTTGMDSGIFLQADQKLWGSGISHRITTSQGIVVVPPQTATAPTITNSNFDTDGNAIVLSTNNTISGFTIRSALNDAIYGVDAQGLDVSFCTFENISTFPIEALFPLDASVSITNNAFLDNVNGILLTLDGTASITCSDNTFERQTSLSSPPIAIIASNNSFVANIDSNLIDGNATGGVHFVLNDVLVAEISLLNNTITNNDIGSQGVFGSSFVVESYGVIDQSKLTMENNLFSGNGSLVNGGARGLYMHTTGEITHLEVNASLNTFSSDMGVLGSPFTLATPSANLTFNASNNTITSVHDNAIAVIAGGTTVVGTVILENNTISNVQDGGNAIVVAQDFSTLNLSVLNNQINECDGSGIIHYAPNGVDSLVLDITGNEISNCYNNYSNAASGIDIEQYQNMSGFITNNTLVDNLDTTVLIGSSLTAPQTCLTFRGNNNTSYYQLSNPIDGLFNLTPCHVDVENIGIINSSGTISLVQSCPDAIPCLD